ncbi:MAG: SusC/RagA family TonB-linked outer membrane protein [Ginsengibacter sp.]
MCKKSKTLFLVLVSILMLPSWILAQTTIKGTVTESTSGNPLEGATVAVKGTNTTTLTNAEGVFTLSVNAANRKLVVSFVGYASQTVNAVNNVSIALVPSSSQLSEVIVSGLATTIKRSNSANAVAVVTAKELLGTSQQSSMDGALYGKFPGANISENSGAPGGGITIKLRGITSIVGNSQPLFIVDGVIYDNSIITNGTNLITQAAAQGSTTLQDNPSNRIADLDPNDIERIEVLKGASAAAIYGSKAAAGVVIITTKRGKSGKAKIELSQSVGSQFQLRKLGTRQWDDTKVKTFYGDNGLAIYHANNEKAYNYEDELYGNHGLMVDSRMSVSGGNENTTYYVGATRDDDKGIVKGTGYLKKSFRISLTQKVTKTIDVSLTSNYVESQADRGLFGNDNTGASMGVAFVSTPSWVNLHPDAQGNYPNNPLAASNFLQTRDLITNRELVNRTTSGGTATWKVFRSAKNSLNVIANGGIDYYTLNTQSVFPAVLQFEKDGKGTNGASIYGTTITRNSNFSVFLVDEFKPNDKISFRTQAGVTQERVDINNVLSTATQMIGTQTNVNQSGAVQVAQAKTIQLDRGFFVQEEFNYRDIFIATAGLRGDKSSRNGNTNKLYYYPKLSGAFNINELPSFNSDIISQLKLRAAYGQSGNFAPFNALYTALGPSVFNGTTGSLILTTRGNDNMKPEKQIEFETGVDAGFFHNRLSAVITYYRKRVEDLILPVQFPASSGFTSFWGNLATIQNKGWEVGLTGVPVKTRDLKWTSTVNFWRNRAIVTQLDVPAFNLGGFGASLGTYRIEKGKSPTQLVGVAGPNDKDKIDPASGLALFGDAEPDFQMSFLQDVTYKNWEFSALVHWKYKGSNINLTTLLSDLSGTSPDFDKKTMDPTHTLDNGDYRNSLVGTSAGQYIQDASYVRIREIGISYHLPKGWFKDIADVKVGFSGRNLFNWFKYNSYDPEQSNFGSNAISSNVEVTPFPSAKSYNFNLSVIF